MKIGIIQTSDAKDIRSHSGMTHFMSKALADHVGDVVHLGPDTSITGQAITFVARLVNRLSYLLFRRRISPTHHRVLAWHAANFFARRIAVSDCDVLYAPFASTEIARLVTHLPVVYHTDLPWAHAVDYYKPFSSLHGFARKEGDSIEAAALSKAAEAIFPSKWAAQKAVDYYRSDPEHVSVAAFGANFEADEVPSAQVATQHSLQNGITLLWVGVDWERKGGTIAIECLDHLLSEGFDARLIVCGCPPPAGISHSKIRFIPFLDKRDPVQRQKLSQLFLDATFFIFPTKTEAVGIVLCEASAHGVPSLARDTGGVAGALFDGINGFLLPEAARGAAYAAKIVELLQIPGGYEKMVLASRQTYEETLNWDAWGRTVKPVFDRVVKSNLANSST